MRKCAFAPGEIYHIYNRGSDKRQIFIDKNDLDRFFQSMLVFNRVSPVGSIYQYSFAVKNNQLRRPTSKLVDIICYCLNPNHFHFILREVVEGGISEFMKRLGGYTKFFNDKYKRSGVLFQGKFKAVHVTNDTQLLHLSAYVNLNNLFKGKIHSISKSSWEEYISNQTESVCSKGIILEQYKTKSEYKKFALSSLKDIKKRKSEELEFET